MMQFVAQRGCSERMRIEVAGKVFVGLVMQYLLSAEVSAVEDWRNLLEDKRTKTLAGDLEAKEYWIELYGARQETASALDTGMANELRRVVEELSRFEGESLVLIMLRSSGFGYMVWASEDFSSVASCIRVRDKRTGE
ncbi:hypothetical protein [Streptomyces sp. NPDC048106]|uniref:hypothetical protein n=1 Tax=Streptomyces sp. NPDC048106 TaxID=3155750 RepID=UPI0034535A0B